MQAMGLVNEHIGIGWLGHDAGHPAPGYVPGFSKEQPPGGIEGQTMFEHWYSFIQILEKRRNNFV